MEAITKEKSFFGATNDDKKYIHFRNVTFDLSTYTFDALRNEGVTQYIDRAFIWNQDVVQKVEQFNDLFASMYVEDKARDLVRLMVASSLCVGGKSGFESFMFCAYGSGSNGKSTLFKFIENMLGPMYYYHINPNALASDIAMNRALQNIPSTCRFLFADDPKKIRVNSSGK
jgi:phage/plasmid-associated DNA primase